jgi:hypothetical protein
MMMLAQAVEMGKAATDLVSARDVVPFMGAAIALLLCVSAYLFSLLRAEIAKGDTRSERELERLSKINDRLTGSKEG